MFPVQAQCMANRPCTYGGVCAIEEVSMMLKTQHFMGFCYTRLKRITNMFFISPGAKLLTFQGTDHPSSLKKIFIHISGSPFQ